MVFFGLLSFHSLRHVVQYAHQDLFRGGQTYEEETHSHAAAPVPADGAFVHPGSIRKKHKGSLKHSR